MRKHALIIGAALALSSLPNVAGNAAVAVTCSNCATMLQQLKDAAIQAKQYALEVKGWLDVANSYATAIQNTVQLPLSALARVQSLYYRTQNLANAAMAIAGPQGSMMERFRMLQRVGRGASGLPGDAECSFEFLGEQWKRQTEENARLLGIEEERRQIMDELLGTAQANADGATGQMQALQAQSQLTSAVATQLQALNLIMTQQMQNQMYKDQEMMARAELYRAAVRKDLDDIDTAIANPAFMDQSPVVWGR